MFKSEEDKEKTYEAIVMLIIIVVMVVGCYFYVKNQPKNTVEHTHHPKAPETVDEIGDGEWGRSDTIILIAPSGRKFKLVKTR